MPPALSLRWEGGQARLSVTGPAGMVCEIQWTDEISPATRWHHLSSCVASASPSPVRDSTASSATTRYYRAVTTSVTNFVWISPGTFIMGSPDKEADRFRDEGPQTVVTLTRGFWMGKCEVTQAEYQAVTGANPSWFKSDPNLPVDSVAWYDATNYCAKLTESERLAGRLPAGWVYRLPREAEWEYAARAGTTTRFSYGDDPAYTNLTNYEWYWDNSGSKTHPVGQKLANPWGLYDMGGNVGEWCSDWYRSLHPGGSVTDPKGPSAGSFRVIRGGNWRRWDGYLRACRSAYRINIEPSYRHYGFGFRVVLAPETQPPPDVIWIAPGAFTMGSPDNEVDRFDNEGPQTVVTLTVGFWMGRHEVTQGEYSALMGANPSWFGGDENLPVETVAWHDATNFCARLTESERLAERLPAGWAYRLPTEAEWEYAARAGTASRFSYGDDPGYAALGGSAWYWSNSGTKTHPIGEKAPNPLGLYDMQGNVWEWCLDWYGDYPGGDVRDPTGPHQGLDRVLRGGSWMSGGAYCRSALRLNYPPDSRYFNLGFRIELAPERQLPANMIWINPGTFTMGCQANEVDHYADEWPQRVVTLTEGYWMGRYEVTQGQYLAVMGANPSSFKSDLSRPVEMVSWYDATGYCGKFTESERLAGRLPAGCVYRLPTEAEWEYAARAGTTNRFSYGDDPGYANLTNYAWYFDNSGGETHPAGQKLANPWGLYDMYGNVLEWCWDPYDSYIGADGINPKARAGSNRVSRGGCLDLDGRRCRSAYRSNFPPDSRSRNLGFRVVLAADRP